MSWQAGQSGNPQGAQKRKRFYDALDRAILQDDSQRLRNAAEKLLDLAQAGEPWAVQMLADRLDGKAAQSLTVSGDAENPLVALVKREVVDAGK